MGVPRLRPTPPLLSLRCTVMAAVVSTALFAFLVLALAVVCAAGFVDLFFHSGDPR